MTAVQHPRHDLDDLLTHAVRFSIVAALAGVEKAEFAAVRDSVEITAPTLSKQVAFTLAVIIAGGFSLVPIFVLFGVIS